MFSEIYQFERENDILTGTGGLGNREDKTKGREFFKNDWFMGPFYSYDANESQMKKKGNGNQQQLADDNEG